LNYLWLTSDASYLTIGFMQLKYSLRPHATNLPCHICTEEGTLCNVA
jgi:hypothetical protein